MKELILKGILEGVQELESFSILDVIDLLIPRVARVVAATKKTGIQIGWLDRIISNIYAKRDHSSLV